MFEVNVVINLDLVGLFVFSDVMTKIDTDAWQYAFLGVTLFTVVIINIMVAIFQVNFLKEISPDYCWRSSKGAV